MKFEDIYIEGFGIYCGYHIERLSSGMTIFVGPNEAGKSTILSFLKRIMYGFPDRRSKLKPYPPLSGGRHGGRITILSGDNKRYVIERYSDSANDIKVHLPDGSVSGSAELSGILGHANKDIFENIYAFGLTELQNFETLNNEAVQERIYSAGTGIGTISLPEVQKYLEKEAGDIFKERGSKPKINSLFKEIIKIDSRLSEIKKDAGNFDSLHEELDEITSDIVNIEQERNQIRTNFNHIANLITAWEDWRKIEEAGEQLQKIPEIESFPENGIEMLERNLDKINEINESISARNERDKKIEMQKSQIIIDEKLIDNKDKILELQKGQDKYVSAIGDLPILKQDLKRDREELKGLLHEIGPDWDEEKLAGFDISIPTKEIVRKKHELLEEARENIYGIEKEAQASEENIRNIKDDVEVVDKDIKIQLFQELDEKTLKQQRKALRLLRVKYTDLKEKEADMRHLEEREEQFEIFKPDKVKSSKGLPLWPALILITAGIAALIISIFLSNLAIGAGVLLILFVAAVVYIVLRRKDRPATIPGALKSKGDELSERKKKLETLLETIKSEMLASAIICGFEEIPDPRLIENKDAELRAAAEELLKIKEFKRQRERLDKKLEKLSEAANIVKKKLEARKKEEEEVQKEWEGWLVEKGLEPGLTPEGTIDIFATVKTCIAKKKATDNLQSRIASIKESVNKYESKILSVLEECNRKNKNIDSIVELEKLYKELSQAEEESSTLKQLVGNKREINIELQTLTEKKKEEERKLSELLSQGFAATEAEFRENARNWRERVELNNKIIGGEQNIKRISGDGKAYEEFISKLEDTSPADLQEKETQLKEKLEGIEENLARFREKRGGISKEIEQLEQREEGSSLRIKQTEKMQALKKKSFEWSMLTLAGIIIGKTMKKYEQERQPGVIKEAQSFFLKMTLGRYPRIFVPLDEAKIYVEDNNGRRKEMQDLSRGTAEQLYLSLRFGFIREFSKRAESLPIIFDDILVNFDPERFKAAGEAIKDLARTNQILYFTCHPESADVLTKIIPESKKIELSISN